jgi:hypothetical protein
MAHCGTTELSTPKILKTTWAINAFDSIDLKQKWLR